MGYIIRVNKSQPNEPINTRSVQGAIAALILRLGEKYTIKRTNRLLKVLDKRLN